MENHHLFRWYSLLSWYKKPSALATKTYLSPLLEPFASDILQDLIVERQADDHRLRRTISRSKYFSRLA
jgi:hypothetical protein